MLANRGHPAMAESVLADRAHPAQRIAGSTMSPASAAVFFMKPLRPSLRGASVTKVVLGWKCTPGGAANDNSVRDNAPMHTVYLDTSVVSRTWDLKIKEPDANALAQLAERDDLHFVTSYKTLGEILNTLDPKRRAMLRFVVGLMDKVRVRLLQYSGMIGGAPIGATMIGAGSTDPLLQQLQTLFDRDDAEHIALAVRDGCDFFVTLDARTILGPVKANRDAVSKMCGALEFVSPKDLVALLTT